MLLFSIACFELEEYETAKRSFSTGFNIRKKMNKDTTLYSRWIRKCDAELESAYAQYT